jgi:hypothetical protein
LPVCEIQLGFGHGRRVKVLINVTPESHDGWFGIVRGEGNDKFLVTLVIGVGE